MSKIFIKKPKTAPCFDGLAVVIELVIGIVLVFLLPLVYFFTYLGVILLYDLIVYLLFRRYPEGTLYSNHNVLYYYHFYKLNAIKFEDIKSIDKVEDKKKFIITFNKNNEEKKLTIRNYEADMLVYELNKTIHKGLKREKNN